MTKFQEVMKDIIDYRHGKLRVPNLQPEQYTFYVTTDIWDDALSTGYITNEGVVTNKFREEYGDMFDNIGRINFV